MVACCMCMLVLFSCDHTIKELELGICCACACRCSRHYFLNSPSTSHYIIVTPPCHPLQVDSQIPNLPQSVDPSSSLLVLLQPWLQLVAWSYTISVLLNVLQPWPYWKPMNQHRSRQKFLLHSLQVFPLSSHHFVLLHCPL